MKNGSPLPVLVPGRKGQRSIADSIAHALSKANGVRRDAWPALTFRELAVLVSQAQGYDVRESTIRSTAYGHPELFESEEVNGKVVWRLTAFARQRLR